MNNEENNEWPEKEKMDYYENEMKKRYTYKLDEIIFNNEEDELLKIQVEIKKLKKIYGFYYEGSYITIEQLFDNLVEIKYSDCGYNEVN